MEAQKPKNQKNNLLTFKKEVEKKLDLLMNDEDEWDIYNDISQIIKKQKYEQLREGGEKPVFIT